MHTPTFTQCIEGYLIAARARRLSQHTIADYLNSFRKFQTFLVEDVPIRSITADHVKRFLAGLNGLSNKTLLNIHTGLSALWNWAVGEKLVECNVVRDVAPPEPEEPAIVPFTHGDIKAMLGALDRSKPYTRPGKRESTHSTSMALRNRAIILTLLDTGLRASELCGINIRDVDRRNQHVLVMGKGSKERSVPYSAPTAQAIWRYLATRGDERLDRPLFATKSGGPLDKDDLGRILRDIGDRAGVSDVHPHRYRHTFAITFLRNGGNVYVLKMLLGHSTLEMCLRYLALAQSDADEAHRHASPVANWRL
jgi:site-specific recombinase XerD